MSVALMLFVGLALLWIVASGKALAVWQAITTPPATAHPPAPAAH